VPAGSFGGRNKIRLGRLFRAGAEITVLSGPARRGRCVPGGELGGLRARQGGAPASFLTGMKERVMWGVIRSWRFARSVGPGPGVCTIGGGVCVLGAPAAFRALSLACRWGDLLCPDRLDCAGPRFSGPKKKKH